MRFHPNIFHKGGKSLVEPDVTPILASDEITKPLMTEFVGDEAVFIGEEFGGDFGMVEGIAGIGGGAGVFHATSDEIIDHRLSVFFPGIINAQLLAEEVNHGRSAAVVHGKTIAAALWGVISNRHAVPGVFRFVELDRKSTRLNSSHRCISYAVFC